MTLTEQDAIERGNVLLTLMPDGWKLRVHENLGWHYAVVKNGVSVRKNHESNKFAYSAFYQPYSKFVGNGNSPTEAIDDLYNQFEGLRSKVERTIAALVEV